MCTFSTSEREKRLKTVRASGVFNIFTWKRALRHNGVHFFDISTSKSAPELTCFVHFDLEMGFAPRQRALSTSEHEKWSEPLQFLDAFDLAMCFAPHRRALFRHLSFQKWSDHGVFCTFWFRNVLRATTAALLPQLNFQKWSETVSF